MPLSDPDVYDEMALPATGLGGGGKCRRGVGPCGGITPTPGRQVRAVDRCSVRAVRKRQALEISLEGRREETRPVGYAVRPRRLPSTLQPEEARTGSHPLASRSSQHSRARPLRNRRLDSNPSGELPIDRRGGTRLRVERLEVLKCPGRTEAKKPLLRG